MNIRCIKESIWSLFMLEMQESAKYMSCKGRSCLSKLSYEDLKCFEWKTLLRKCSFISPCFWKLFLSYPQDNEHHYLSLAKKLGLIYGILMKRRSHILSQVQRVIAVAIAQENLYQKVKCSLSNKIVSFLLLAFFCTLLWKLLIYFVFEFLVQGILINQIHMYM